MEKTEKNKILYIITKSNWGGAQKHVFDLVTNIQKEKFDTVVVAGGNGPLHENLKNIGVKTIQIEQLKRDVNILKDLFSAFSLIKIINEEKPSVIHLHSTKAGALGAFLARIYNLDIIFQNWFLPISKKKTTAKIIFTAHGWAFKENRVNYQKILIYLYSWLTIFLSHKTIVVSKDDLKKSPQFLVKNKLVLIHNGISDFKTLPRLEAQKQIFVNQPIYPNNLCVGSIAELHKNKGLSYAVEAIAEINRQEADKEHPILFGVISDGEEKSNLENLIKKNNLEKKVFLAGQKMNAKQMLSAFDLFLLPSLKEGLPYSILEAGYAGLPVIATNVGGIGEVITDSETGIIIRPSDIKEISNALKFFIQNPEKINEFGGKLKKRISEQFSLQKMVEKTLEIYDLK